MGVWRFEDLRVWQAAKRLSDRVGELIKRPDFAADARLADQINGAAISSTNNIAEGFLRRRDREMAQFLRWAAASNGEVRACLYNAHGRDYLDDQEASDLIEQTNAIGRMLTRWQQKLPKWPRD